MGFFCAWEGKCFLYFGKQGKIRDFGNGGPDKYYNLSHLRIDYCDERLVY